MQVENRLKSFIFCSAGHLCVLKGGDIQYGSSNRFRNPPIVFGALTLNSLYFAADASTGRIGFAQKPDPSGGCLFFL